MTWTSEPLDVDEDQPLEIDAEVPEKEIETWLDEPVESKT